MIIQNNIPAMKTLNKATAHKNKLDKQIQKLSSGLRINQAADDASGLAISEKMRGQIRGLSQANQNISEGIDLLNVGDGAMAEIHDITQRMLELSVKAATDTSTSADRHAIQEEADQLLAEIDKIAHTTHFNGIYMLTGSKDKVVTPESPSNGGSVGGSGGVGTIVGDGISSALANRITYGGSGDDSLGNMLFEDDGTAVFCGTSNSADQDLAGVAPGAGGWVCKIGEDGEPLWSTKTATGSVLNSLVKTKDGGYLAGGGKGGNAYFAKLDAYGNLEWDYETGAGDEAVRGMIVNADGDILVTTQTFSYGTWQAPDGQTIGGPPKGGRDTIVLKMDPTVDPNTNFYGCFKRSDGNAYAGLNVGGNGNEQLYKIAPTDDGGFIATGYTLSEFPGMSENVGIGVHDIWVARFDKDGNPVKYLNYGDDKFVNSAGGSGSQIIQTSDGGFILVGSTNMTGANGTDVPTVTGNNNLYIIKMTKDLVPEWSKSYGSSGNDAGSCVVETEDGYIIAGTVAANDGDVTTAGLGGADAWVIKINKSGDMLWDQTYGGAGSDSFNYMYQTESGDIFLAGTSGSNDHDLDGKNKGNLDAWFLKISSRDGTIVEGVVTPSRPPSTSENGGDLKYGENSGDIILQVGANSHEAFVIKRADMRLKTLFGVPTGIIMDPWEMAERSIDKLQGVIVKISAERGRFGAYINALDSIMNNNENYHENILAAESRIRDTDIAKQTMGFWRGNVMLQSAQTMLAQANQMPQQVLQLLK